MYKISKLQAYIIQHREYNQHFIKAIHQIQPLKIVEAQEAPAASQFFLQWWDTGEDLKKTANKQSYL